MTTAAANGSFHPTAARPLRFSWKNVLIPAERIEKAILLIRKHKVMLDRDRRPPSCSSRMLVPVMSDGMRSGVNWMRLNDTSRI